MKILILEDEIISLTKLQKDLESMGHTVLTSMNSVEAFSNISKHGDIDLVISDLKLPYDSGIDFVKDVREINKKLPLLIISGTLDRNTLHQIKKLNCIDMLVKPYDKNRLISILEKIKG